MDKLYYEALCAFIALVLMAFASIGAWYVFSHFDREMGRGFAETATITHVRHNHAKIETQYGELYTCRLEKGQGFTTGETVRVVVIQGRLSRNNYCGGLTPLQ